MDIGGGAFADCTALDVLDLPESVRSLEYQAFKGCTALFEMTLPAAMEYLGAGVFEGCSALTEVNFDEIEGWESLADDAVEYVPVAPETLEDPEAVAAALKDTLLTVKFYRMPA